jgi:hypothetical protein
MRSRGDRPTLESGLRLAATVVLIALLLRALRPAAPDTTALATSGTLDSALAAWTVAPPAAVRLEATAIPTRTQRDWLRALKRTGTAVEWALADSPPTRSGGALVVEPVASPGGLSRLTLIGPPGDTIPLVDALGELEAVENGPRGALTLRSGVRGLVRAAAGAARPAAARRDSFLLRPVLVTGMATWESKFVVAALEEAGWDVRTRLSVAPAGVVVQGGEVPIDTARLSAVVLLDSIGPPPAATLRRFVESGGGLIAAGSAGAISGIAGLLPGRGARRRPGMIGALDGPEPRSGLVGRVFSTVARDAVPLERRGEAPIVLAAREGAGRVLQVGYEDTWRWRMLGGIDAPESHRAWWSALVSSVAYAPVVAIDAPFTDEAPLAAAVASLGRPSDATTAARGATRLAWEAILFAIACLALLGEWLSRRLRGER